MRALVLDRFGGPDVLHMAEIERPEPGPGQVLIRLSHAGVNPADWKAREGWLSAFFDYQFPFILGFDGAGWVEAVGDGVEGLTSGDRVVTACNQGKGERGTYAAFVVSDAERVVVLPDDVSFEAAAAVPTAGMTAMEALFDVGDLKHGQHVLVNGGAGGTGGYAIRMAVAAGARVAATCGPNNLDYLRTLGVDLAINYRDGDMAAAIRNWAPDGLDLVVDTVGQGTLVGAVDWVKPGGVIAPISTLIAGEKPHEPEGQVRIVPTTSTFPNQPRQLRNLVHQLAAGLFSDIVVDVVPLEHAAEAHRRVEAGHVRGKIVLAIGAAN